MGASDFHPETRPRQHYGKKVIDLKRRKGMLSIRDLYFCPSREVAANGEDIQFFVQAADGSGRGGQHFYSSVLDLEQDEATLMAGIRKGFVYEIRRARERDRIVPLIWDAPDALQITQFCAFFDSFAGAKSLGTANRGKLELLAQSKALVLSVSIEEGNPERWYSAHAYICDGRRARLLYSAGNVALHDAEERKVQGRANKLLHWNMIEYFKAHAYAEYDMGGISKSEALQAIDDFKLGFGGREVLEYNYLIGITLLGKLTALGFTFAGKLRDVRSSRKV